MCLKLGDQGKGWAVHETWMITHLTALRDVERLGRAELDPIIMGRICSFGGDAHWVGYWLIG